MRKLVASMILCASMSGYAQTYKCITSGGEKVFQDTPCASNAKVKEEYYFAPPPVAPAKLAQQSTDAARPGAPTSARPFSKHKDSPTIRVFHDPRGMPAKFSLGAVEGGLQEVVAKWSERCNVNLVFAGSTRADAPARQSATTGYTIQWDVVGRSKDGTRVGGLGGPAYGVTLSAYDMRSIEYFRSVAAHELGHALGIAHIHEDRKSVMSYLRHRDGGTLEFSESDYVSCNMAMNSRFGVPYEAPAGVQKPTMSDEDARRQMEAEARNPNRRSR